MRFIKPGSVDGICRAPSSKSELQRAIAAAFLARGRSEISFFSLCDDSRAALNIVEALGASVQSSDDMLIVEAGIRKPASSLDCGESGLCLRMFAPIAALFEEEITLTGRGSLFKRPIDMIESGLRNAGVRCQGHGGFPPLIVQGPLSGGKIILDGSQSSQHVTGFLMALPLAEGDSEIIVDNVRSKPYIELTLAVMSAFGVSAIADFGRGHFSIRGSQHYLSKSYSVEGDWSGAAFLLVAGAVAGSVTVTDLNPASLQADRNILRVLKECGAAVSFYPQGITVSRSSLSAFDFNAEDAPDLFPPLAVLACYCRGKSRIRGAGRLRYKESARANALVDVLGRMGASIRLDGDTLEINGSDLKGGKVESHNDHRIAMAAAIAALGSQRRVELDHPECVSKSYPHFFEDLGRLKTGGS
jgi:3-phosphoshikimate 1-carboxyvinyltransferase